MIANRRFRLACLTVLLLSAVFFSVVLYIPQFLEKILDYSVLEAGAGMLPMMAFFALTSFIAGPLYNRIGMRVVVGVGTGMIFAGMLLLGLLISPTSGLGSLIPGLIVLGIGVGLFYPSITTAAVTALDASRASLAGGIVYMFQIAGGAVGLGAATTLFTLRSEHVLDRDASQAGVALTDHQQAVLHGDLAGTDAAAEALTQLPTGAADEITRIVRDSFASGVQTSFRVIAAVALVGFLVAVLGLARTEDPDVAPQ